MKICNICKTIMEDDAAFCPRCKNTDLAPFETTRCTFCNAEIAVGTVVCPHCHRIQPPDENRREDVVPTVTKETAKATLFEKVEEEDAQKVKEEVKTIVEKEIGDKTPEGAKEIKTEVFERKTPEGATIIYNQIYTAPPQSQTVEDEELSSYKLRGTPTIVSVDKDGFIKENKKLERVYIAKKIKPKKVEPAPIEYKLAKNAYIYVIVAAVLVAAGIAAGLILNFVNTKVMQIGGFGVATLYLPFDGYSNFGAYAEKTQLGGTALMLYNSLPYALDANLVFGVFAIAFTLLTLLSKKGLKITAIVLSGLYTAAALYITFVQSYIFDFGRVGIGVYVILAAGIAAIVALTVGVKLEKKQ